MQVRKAQGFCAESCPVVIRGVYYKSQTAAAKAVGVKRSAIWKMLEKGNLENAGLGRNCWSKKPVIIDGVPYESAADGARSIGARPDAVNKAARAVRNGKLEYVIYKNHKVEVPK